MKFSKIENKTTTNSITKYRDHEYQNIEKEWDSPIVKGTNHRDKGEGILLKYEF